MTKPSLKLDLQVLCAVIEQVINAKKTKYIDGVTNIELRVERAIEVYFFLLIFSTTWNRFSSPPFPFWIMYAV